MAAAELVAMKVVALRRAEVKLFEECREQEEEEEEGKAVRFARKGSRRGKAARLWRGAAAG